MSAYANAGGMAFQWTEGKSGEEETRLIFPWGLSRIAGFGQSGVRQNRRTERECFYVRLCPDILQVSQRALDLKSKYFLVHNLHTGLIYRNKSQSCADGTYKMAQRLF